MPTYPLYVAAGLSLFNSSCLRSHESRVIKPFSQPKRQVCRLVRIIYFWHDLQNMTYITYW